MRQGQFLPHGRLPRALTALALWFGLVTVPTAAASPVLLDPPEAGTPEEEEEEEAPALIAPDPAPEPEPEAPATSKSKTAKPGKKPTKSASAKKPKGDPRCGGKTPIWEHTVKSGENLGRIAGMYGVRQSDITRLNAKLKKNPDKLSIGQKILVCPDPEVPPHLEEEGSYTVKKGDSLSEIAEKHHMKVGELIALQKGSLRKRLDANKSDLRPGDEITIMIDRGIIAAFAPKKDEDRGVLRVGIPLDPGKHFYIKRPNLAFGTGATIKAIKAAISKYAQLKGIKGGPQVHVGDISARGGGPLKGHKSHQKGVDVDVGLVLKGADAKEVRFLSGNADNLDVARTWALIKSFVDTKEVRAIFLDYGLQKILYEHAKKKGVPESKLDELFQYPRGKGRGFGIIRHWKGHRDHFHVRFHR
ncbi:penicillin-insensitive murein endopeptidase [Nannocystis sp. SCPEA4]|uniref:penicillin-insensitive murein endopeptidase n=1 Tax=Nannocystis sp. SCPEA4 TaxID=2996787 RepID=UPI00226EB968|nr:penicillin-insensitive murein endopeptidase [Nannocystis sp. SCPEA4]MCY1061895.1 penicillin-insensitive murein endopeptidase [Nannocystis sp. SCPEA4]